MGAAAATLIANEIKAVQEAIKSTETSKDPQFLAIPSKRAELLELLRDRLDRLRGAEEAEAVALARASVEERQKNAWQRLEPQRWELVQRWAELQKEQAAVLAAAGALDAQHRSECGRPALTEGLGRMHLITAQLTCGDGGRIVVGSVPFCG